MKRLSRRRARRSSLRALEALEGRCVLDSTVVFSEVMYHPRDEVTQSEWIELHNQMAVDMDLSGWTVEGVNYQFPVGTIMPGGSYLVIAKDPSQLASAAAGATVFGPFAGRLSNAGEALTLKNVGGRTMDALTYGDDTPWPPAADGGGVTLAKRDANQASGMAHNWEMSAQLGGTPSGENFLRFAATPIEHALIRADSVWRYHAAGHDLGSAWRTLDFADTDWSTGQSVLYAGQFAGIEPPDSWSSMGGSSVRLANASFEANTNAGVGYGGVDGWTTSGSTGINPAADGSSPFADNGVTPDRRQIAFIQGRGSLGQVVSGLEVGQDYWLELHYNARACCGAEPTITVSLAGQVVLAPTPVEPVGAGVDYHVALLPFTATATSGQLLIRNVGSTGDHSLLIDAVTITPRAEGQIPLQNGSFEASGVVSPEPGILNPPVMAGWHATGEGKLGIAAAGSAMLGATTVPDGQQAVYLESAVSLTQTLSGLVTGQSYELRLQVNATSGVPAGLELRLDNQLAQASTVDAQTEFQSITQRFTAGGTNVDLTISQVVSGATLLIDQIELRQVNSPLVTEIPLGADTTYFRFEFEYDGVSRQTELTSRYFLDDGAVVYLNGQELYRTGLPAGTPTYATLATAPVVDPVWSDELKLTNTSLIRGRNVLAVEVHQAARPDTDLAMALELRATETPLRPEEAALPVAINELSGATDGVRRVELNNFGDIEIAANELLLTLDGAEVNLPNGPLSPGAFRVVELPPSAATSDLIVLSNRLTTELIDAAHLPAGRTARFPDGEGPFYHAAELSVGGPNLIDVSTPIVINEIMYHQQPRFAAAETPPTYAQTPLVMLDSVWRYNDSGELLGTNWANSSHTVGGNWRQGPGLLGFETGSVVAPGLGTTLQSGTKVTYYLETDFTVSAEALARADQFLLRHAIDDGAVVYLNGTEVARFNLPDGVVTGATLASRSINNAELSDLIVVPSSLVHAGVNRLSLEVHQRSANSSDLIAGAEFSLAEIVKPGAAPTPFVEDDTEWIELYNRGDAAIDLTGWRLAEAVDYEFAAGTTIVPGGFLVVARDPAGLAAQFPGTLIVGPFTGRLSDGDERIELRNELGNPVDEVHYFDEGRWPAAADGRGASLELIDPHADNDTGESWASSDTQTSSEWHHYSYRAVASEPANLSVPNLFDELIIGLLDAGEILLDDLRLIEDPDGRKIERLQNGSFTNDQLGQSPAAWRWLGTHQQSQVVLDPDDPSNPVLRLVATAPTEHMHNHGETTLADRAQINESIYELSFRARWISGSPQLNTRLYFSRMAKTTLIETGARYGTPGRANSRWQDNSGPTYGKLAHSPLAPKPSESVTVSVMANDPDGVQSLTLHYSVAGGPFVDVPMSRVPSGEYSGQIPGQASASVVQFYVTGIDTRGTASHFPQAGSESRALFEVAGALNSRDAHTLRVVMTRSDTSRLHDSTNVMSNATLGATVIYDDREVFYNVGVRLRSSGYGRQSGLAGFNISFDPQQLFRGVHGSVSLDRGAVFSSGTGGGGVQGVPGASPHELLIYQIANRAGGIAAMYDDVVFVDAPRAANTGFALLKMARHTDVFLDSQYENGGDGSLFKFELIYHSTQTIDGNPESRKRPPAAVLATDISNLGPDQEAYRHNFVLKNNTDRDDFSALVELGRTFSLTGTALEAAADAVMDVDQWMRTFALLSLVGTADVYNMGLAHNLELFVRPEDGKVLAMPWDVDHGFYYSPRSNILGAGGSNLAKVIARPPYQRLFYKHLLDLVQHAYNLEAVAPWATHYTQMTGHGDAQFFQNYVRDRAAYVNERLSVLAPSVSFAITTNNGEPLTVTTPTVTLQGNGWIDVDRVRLAGQARPLSVKWLDGQHWQLESPLSPGENQLQFEALNYRGEIVGSDTMVVNSTAPISDLAQFLRIAEVMYHPVDPSAAELTINPDLTGDDFEFIELANLSDRVELNLAGLRLTDGPSAVLELAADAGRLPPGARAILVANPDAFALRYGTSPRVVGTYAGNLRNSGELLRLEDPLGRTIVAFEYTDTDPWPADADGQGPSLELIDLQTPVDRLPQGELWRASAALGGSPGRDGTGAGDLNHDGRVNDQDIDLLCGADSSQLQFDLNGDAQVNDEDLSFLVENLLRTNFGDADLNGVFDSSDFVKVFQAGTYEDQLAGNATWATGDWNCDGDFNTADLVKAFQSGGFVAAARPQANIRRQ